MRSGQYEFAEKTESPFSQAFVGYLQRGGGPRNFYESKEEIAPSRRHFTSIFRQKVNRARFPTQIYEKERIALSSRHFSGKFAEEMDRAVWALGKINAEGLRTRRARL